MMSLILLGSCVAVGSAFRSSLPLKLTTPILSQTRTPASFTKLNSSAATKVDITENVQRNIASLYEWGANYGVQMNCFEISSEDTFYGADYYAIANQNLPAESPIVCVPSDLIMTGNKCRQDFGTQASAERVLKLSCHTAFYLFLKVLSEYENGYQSPWFPWLNSLPRFYSTAASMTDFCYSCLPPYAAKQGRDEKARLKRFELALDNIPFLSDETKRNQDLIKWAYNVVYTRYHETPGGDWVLVPLGDYFNHGGSEVDVYLSYDGEGNCYCYTTRDVQAGQPLRICYGDQTNPSQLLAKYGFLDESSPGTYCKWIAKDPSPQLFDLGYPNRMLFYNDGSVSSEVWDVLLYEELGKVSEGQQTAFYQAHLMGDDATKAAYHNDYFAETLAVLQTHVDSLLEELGALGLWQLTYDQTSGRHPRLPLIMRHNEFVKNTFALVQQNLNQMQE
eukprot:CAMPEP_0172573862 /NCGR_PEP_ID=MMETSP1067-20121228/136410_1 /TAXON_ID=265564 ORGANISM="Thalassiosira punctigera, Strain Tpunct2005C2" /NCGR_SAMPLE_ID=MMETSP1067 /ASSEMBLY_ACC=CAM_ASM_000444 /LENGTH=448 /DNA_ID=CAMNT_0013366481 /DNA_START=977 /DNA_END=2323 /DNA_ORIENTATION=-